MQERERDIDRRKREIERRKRERNRYTQEREGEMIGIRQTNEKGGDRNDEKEREIVTN